MTIIMLAGYANGEPLILVILLMGYMYGCTYGRYVLKANPEKFKQFIAGDTFHYDGHTRTCFSLLETSTKFVSTQQRNSFCRTCIFSLL
jgi:hypothetical protein